MKNLYNQAEAEKFVKAYPGLPPKLAHRIYTSRLLGKESELVLHGGGNTSVKLTAADVVGGEIEVLYVKGSGVDLAAIGPEGLPGLDLAALQRLRRLENLSDEEMANQLLQRRLRADSPAPSVDTLTHAFLPYTFIDHTHADAILALTNQERGPELVREALGGEVIVLPYIHPGFPQAKALAQACEERPEAVAAVILGHGIFTFGSEAGTAYELMIEYVSRAEAFLEQRGRTKRVETAPPPSPPARPEPLRRGGGPAALARTAQTIRGACAHPLDGGLRRFLVEIRTSPEIRAASLSPEAGELCRSGVLTPDHAIRTKNAWACLDSVPEDDKQLAGKVQEAVRGFMADYALYYQDSIRDLDGPPMLDPYPRVFLVAGGLFCLGFTRREARIAADIAEHTLRAKIKAQGLGPYAPLEPARVFEMEYWPLQQKKLAQGPRPLLAGQIALVTGGAGAIALGVADRLLAAGAAVAISDIDATRLEKVKETLANRHGGDRIETIVFDVTDYQAVAAAYEDISLRLGGLDIVVPNAGLAQVATIEALDPDRLDQVMAVNFKGAFNVIKAAIPVFRRQGTGGNIVGISSKNVFDPGAAFGAYSASKAAAHQLEKIAALELAELGVRVNMINPDAIFGEGEITSKLWDLVGPDRMRARGLDPEGLQEYYRNRNLLKARITAEHVGNAVVFFAGNLTPTTGATLPVDGGVQGAFPR